MNEQMREDYEAWASHNGISIVRCTQGLMFANGQRRAEGDYIAIESLCAWEAWMASQESMIPDFQELMSSLMSLPPEEIARRQAMGAEEFRKQFDLDWAGVVVTDQNSVDEMGAGNTAVDMGNAAADGRRSLYEYLMEKLAVDFPDSETTMTVECFADWMSKEVKP